MQTYLQCSKTTKVYFVVYHISCLHQYLEKAIRLTVKIPGVSMLSAKMIISEVFYYDSRAATSLFSFEPEITDLQLL